MEYSQKMIALPFEQNEMIFDEKRLDSLIYLTLKLCKYGEKIENFRELILNLTKENSEIKNELEIVKILKNLNINSKFILNEKIKESLNDNEQKEKLYTTITPTKIKSKNWIIPKH